MSAFRDEFSVGWRDLIAATIGIAFGVTSFTTLSSLFFRAFEQEFGWSRAVAAGALIALPITGLALPLTGWLVDRFGVRLVSGLSVICVVLSYVALAHLSGDVTTYYALIVALFVLGSATGPVAYTRLVAVRFTQARGTALAIAQFGVSLLTIVLPPILGAILADGGWRQGYWLMAGLTLLGGVCAQLMMQSGGPQHSTARGDGMSPRKAAATPHFWMLGGAIFVISAASLGFVAQFQSVVVDRGITPAAANWLLSLLAGSVLISRLLVGRVLDLAYPNRWSAAALAFAATGFMLMVAGPTGLLPTSIAVVLIGFSLGAELDLMSFFCARLFGLRNYAAIYGFLATFYYTGTAAGGISYGAVRDSTGSYAVGLGIAALLLLLAALLFAALGAGPREEEGKS